MLQRRLTRTSLDPLTKWENSWMGNLENLALGKQSLSCRVEDKHGHNERHTTAPASEAAARLGGGSGNETGGACVPPHVPP
jgi:hypothetical protein